MRIHKGNPKADHETQKVDYVKIIKNKQPLDAKGNPIKESPNVKNPADTSEAHIPYEEWVNWRSWDKP